MVNGACVDVVNEGGKPLSQAAIGRELGLAPATMTKLKGQGMPVDSVESARAWRTARQNIAQRKPEPVPAKRPAPVVPPAGAYAAATSEVLRDMIRAKEVSFDDHCLPYWLSDRLAGDFISLLGGLDF